MGRWKTHWTGDPESPGLARTLVGPGAMTWTSRFFVFGFYLVREGIRLGLLPVRSVLGQFWILVPGPQMRDAGGPSSQSTLQVWGFGTVPCLSSAVEPEASAVPVCPGLRGFPGVWELGWSVTRTSSQPAKSPQV